uniref:Reverse transcriptase domain-containing protein n=1 Tax=Tanacetum cinerariifolium TaxID=118510 RepID=A0A699L3M5_TANCI|nr:hypothetical protein [Tanacetum cinerariifolium]
MTANKIDVTDEACEEYSQEVLGLSDITASGSPTPSDDPIVSTTSPTLTLFGDSDFLLFEEADTFLGLEDDPNSLEFNPFYYDPKGDILMLEAILNSDPSPSHPLPNHEPSMPSFKKEIKACEAKTIKSSIDEPPEGINPEFCTHKILMEEDYKLAVQHQRLVNPKIHDVIKKEVEKLLDAGLIYPISDSPWVSPVHCVPKKGGFTVVKNEENKLIPTRLVTGWRTMEVFMDDLSIFGNSFKNCLSRLDKMLQRCEDTKLCLNWEKSHFMVKEGIVLGHKISKNEIEIDKAKVDVITKLPHLTTIKDCIKAFQRLKKKLTEAPILIAPNWDLPFELMCDEFDFDVLDMKGAENLAADHLPRLENPYENVLDPKEINETFPLETLSTVTFRGDSSASWFADFANYHAGNFIVKGMLS